MTLAIRAVAAICLGLLAICAPSASHAQYPATVIGACRPLTRPPSTYCQDRLIETIGYTYNESVIVFVSYFSDREIGDAISEYGARGKLLTVIGSRREYDNAQSVFSQYYNYWQENVEHFSGYLLRGSGTQGDQHNKIIITMGMEPDPDTGNMRWFATLVTGSYNFTINAQNNFENMVFMRFYDPVFLQQFLANELDIMLQSPSGDALPFWVLTSQAIEANCPNATATEAAEGQPDVMTASVAVSYACGMAKRAASARSGAVRAPTLPPVRPWRPPEAPPQGRSEPH